MAQNDGGPAFPVIAENGLGHVADGMSLRDWFAGQALAGFLADGSQRLVAEAIEESADRVFIQDTKALAALANEAIARGVYALADAMLAAREEGPAS
jgi:hypothetical protein